MQSKRTIEEKMLFLGVGRRGRTVRRAMKSRKPDDSRTTREPPRPSVHFHSDTPSAAGSFRDTASKPAKAKVHTLWEAAVTKNSSTSTTEAL